MLGAYNFLKCSYFEAYQAAGDQLAVGRIRRRTWTVDHSHSMSCRLLYAAENCHKYMLHCLGPRAPLHMSTRRSGTEIDVRSPRHRGKDWLTRLKMFYCAVATRASRTNAT